MRIKATHSNETSIGALGVLGVLQIIFIVLKLCGLIDWSWWAVLIPMFIDLVCFLIGLLFMLGVLLWQESIKH